MKKILFIILIVLPLMVFSQSNKEILEKYLSTAQAKSSISNRDFNDWIIESEGGSTSSGIQNCYVLQRYQGIEIFRAVSNFAIKSNKVIDVKKRIVEGVSNKVNAIKPSLSVSDALTKAYFYLGIEVNNPFSILENAEQNKFKLTNGIGIEEPVLANLVYHQAKDNKLILAWDFTIHTQKQDHLWSVRIDALTGKMLEKNDFVISCSFDRNKVFSTATDNSLTKYLGMNSNSFLIRQIAKHLLLDGMILTA
jgi:hypothetical protein